MSDQRRVDDASKSLPIASINMDNLEAAKPKKQVPKIKYGIRSKTKSDKYNDLAQHLLKKVQNVSSLKINSIDLTVEQTAVISFFFVVYVIALLDLIMSTIFMGNCPDNIKVCLWLFFNSIILLVYATIMILKTVRKLAYVAEIKYIILLWAGFGVFIVHLNMSMLDSSECPQYPFWLAFWTINAMWLVFTVQFLFYFVLYFLSFSVRISDCNDETYANVEETTSDSKTTSNVEGTSNFKYAKF